MERQLSVSFNFLKIYMNLSEQPPHCHPPFVLPKAKSLEGEAPIAKPKLRVIK